MSKRSQLIITVVLGGTFIWFAQLIGIMAAVEAIKLFSPDTRSNLQILWGFASAIAMLVVMIQLTSES